MAKKKAVSRQKRTVPTKSVTLTEQNPASVDVESYARVLRKKSRQKKK